MVDKYAPNGYLSGDFLSKKPAKRKRGLTGSRSSSAATAAAAAATATATAAIDEEASAKSTGEFR